MENDSLEHTVIVEESGLAIMKFGGTSLGSAKNLEKMTGIVAEATSSGRIVLVVSAMQHSTDWLLEAASMAAKGDLVSAEKLVDRVSDLAISNVLLLTGNGGGESDVTTWIRQTLSELRRLLHAISQLRESTPRTRDLVLSFGERVSAYVVAEILSGRGVPAMAIDARDFIVTDDTFGMAEVDCEASATAIKAISSHWNDGRIPVITGFLGRTQDGRSTTLGRNGSDYTATLLAKWLGASEVVVWTDVPGVMTGDPAIVPDAYPLRHMSYSEALELVDYGASMFHPRTLIPLIESGIPMRIRNTGNPTNPGTLIDTAGSTDSASATSVTSLENLALIGVQVRRISLREAIGGRVLRALELAGVTIWMSNQSAHGQTVAVVVPFNEQDLAVTAVQSELAIELERGDVDPVSVRKPVTLLSLVAEAMGQTVGVTGRFFSALGQVGVGILAISQGSTLRSVSCVVDAADTKIAVRTVHAAFAFAHHEVSLLVVGKGVVGSQLLAQISAQGEALLRDHDVMLRVVGIVGSRGAVFDERGIDLKDWRARMSEAESSGKPTDLNAMMSAVRRLPVPILVDCTAADGMEDVYKAAFSHGIHVVSANKKPLTVPGAKRREMARAARVSSRFHFYETTVGASLPVIDTLMTLVRTGDRVLRIEGCFSGTLGYVANGLMADRSISEVVQSARDLGYTEPNPAEDLSGMDVARKALILAREMGLELDIDDVVVEPMINLEIGDSGSVPALFEALRARDQSVSAEIDAMKAEGRMIRYLATINPYADVLAGEALVSVGPVAVEPAHPAGRLEGTDSMVAFTTERYRDRPLVVQGSGAGGAVTAAGVLADILKVSMTLRGR